MIIHNFNPATDLDSAYDYYWQNGFAIFDKVISDDVCDQVSEIFKQRADENFSSIIDHGENEYVLNNIVKNPDIVRIVERLVGAECCAAQVFYLFKEPNSKYASQSFNPHQDNSYPQSEPGAYVAVDIPLVDQDAENGGLLVWPGTHRLGLLPFEGFTGHREKEGENPGNRVIMPESYILDDTDWIRDDETRDAGFTYERIALVLKKGQAMPFHGDLIHASLPNNSTRPRPTIFPTYIKASAGRTAQRFKIPLR